MAIKCDFCEKGLKNNEGYNVKEVVIDKNPGIIKLSDVLLDLYFCELDVSKICSECMDVISKQFIFKQKLRKNLKMPNSNVIVQISKFLNKTKEKALVSEHCNILSIFPEDRKKLVETIKNFSPEVVINDNQKEIVVVQKDHPSVPMPIIKTELVNYKSSTDTNDSDDSNYGENKKSRKRKKKSKGGSAKKQKANIIVKEQPEIDPFLNINDDSSYVGNKRESGLCNSTGLEKKLDEEQVVWLNNVIKSTERSGIYYFCKFCYKELKSVLAMRYHYINRHLLKKMSKKQVWIAHKIKAGIIQVKREEDGKKMTQWKCTECSKIYKNAPGLRYHLTKHLKDDFDETFDTSVMD